MNNITVSKSIGETQGNASKSTEQKSITQTKSRPKNNASKQNRIKKAKKNDDESVLYCERKSKKVSSAQFHGFDVLEIDVILDIILQEENNKTTPQPIDWDSITSKVNYSIGKKFKPETLQRLWKYLAYGQLFASSSSQINGLRSKEVPMREMFVPPISVPCEAFPSSDEEDYLCSPEEYSEVDHTVAVLIRRNDPILPTPIDEVSTAAVTAEELEVGQQYTLNSL